MFRIRKSYREDVEQVLAVSEHLDTVNLPHDRKVIEGILDRSDKSFSGELPPGEREFVFVLEDLEKRKIIGTSMIYAQHGTKRAPHIFFRVENDERYSVTLDRYFVHQTLRIGYNYNGPTEIGGLILLPEYRRSASALGKSLSYQEADRLSKDNKEFIHALFPDDPIHTELLPDDVRALIGQVGEETRAVE